jgi:prepilin-type processing-associated H-X9-DG protein
MAALLLSFFSFALIFLGPIFSIYPMALGLHARRMARQFPRQFEGKWLATAAILISACNILGTISVTTFLYWNPDTFPLTASVHAYWHRENDAQSLQTVLTAIDAYTKDHNGEFPPHLAAVTPYLPDPKVLVARTSGTQPLEKFPTGKTPQEMITVINKHCDIVYKGSELNTATLISPEKLIILHHKTRPEDQAINVIFADGHVEYTQRYGLQTLLRYDHQARNQIALSKTPPNFVVPSTSPARPESH